MPSRDSNAQNLLLPGLCLCAALLSAAGGCGKPADGKLEVRQPRFSLRPGAGTAAVYLTVVNPGSQSDRLVRIETAAARLVTIHESVIEKNGVVRMVERKEGFEVPAGGTLELAPLGKHIMLTDPQKPPGEPGPIHLTLHFKHAGPVEVQAAYSGVEEMAMDHGDHGDMDHGGTDHGGMDHGGMDHGDHAAPKPGGGS